MKIIYLTIGLFIVLAAPVVRADAPPSSTNGLVALYTFSGNANDSSGHGHDGTVLGATLTTDRFGNANNAYFFDGSALIDIPSSTNFNFVPATGLTISAWAYGSGFISSGEHLVGRRPPSGNFWQMAIGPGAIDASHIPVNQWFQYVLTFGPTVQGYYINGVLDTTQTFAIGAMTANVDVLIGGSGSFQKFIGSMDEVRIYNRLLTPGEIQELYQYEVPEPGSLALFGAGAGICLLKRGRRQSRP